MWPPRSKYASFQAPAALFYIRTMTFVRAWICADDTRAFHLQPKVGDATSAKTMVRRSPGLLDLLRRPCSDKAIAWLLGFPYGYVKVKMVPPPNPQKWFPSELIF